MKNIMQTLACAAMLAVGGFNAWMLLGNGDSEAELQIDNAEALAVGEGVDSRGYGYERYFALDQGHPVDRGQMGWEYYYYCAIGNYVRYPLQECVKGESIYINPQVYCEDGQIYTRHYYPRYK